MSVLITNGRTIGKVSGELWEKIYYHQQNIAVGSAILEFNLQVDADTDVDAYTRQIAFDATERVTIGTTRERKWQRVSIEDGKPVEGEAGQELHQTIQRARALVKKIPKGREAALVATKLDEAALWLAWTVTSEAKTT